MSSQDTSPSVKKTAFACPYCGAYTSQIWYNVYLDKISNEARMPNLVDEETLERIKRDENLDPEVKDGFVKHIEQLLTKSIFVRTMDKYESVRGKACNLFISSCYECNKPTLWRYDTIIYPQSDLYVTPNPDMPDDVQTDFLEAGSIVQLSPRGAAALLRLAIQKLCKNLGEKGENINADIKELVAKGLSPKIQKSLDIVRVIGNEAVHPGELDLKDNLETATALFKLVNLIVEEMISIPNSIDNLYDELPEKMKKAIEVRDSS